MQPSFSPAPTRLGVETVNVAITGLGVAGPCGLGRDALADALARGVACSVAVDRSHKAHARRGSMHAALCAGDDLSRWVPPAAARRMSRPSRLAVAAARMAIDQSGIDDIAADDTAVVMGTAFGPGEFTERLLRGILADPETASPFLFTECVANAPAAEIALVCGARGPNITVTQREAGPLIAIARAADEIASGRSRCALAGSVDEMTPVMHAALDRFRALTRGSAPRPFDRERDGFLAGEGAATVAMESVDTASARGSRILAKVRAWGGAFDPTASPSTWGTGHRKLGASLLRWLERRNIKRKSIGAIVSGASGSRRGDRLEALTLRAAWEGLELPPVLAPKGVVGEYGGGALPAAVLAIEGAAFGRLDACRTLDPELGLSVHDGSALPALERVLVTSFAAGGAAAWLILEKP